MAVAGRVLTCGLDAGAGCMVSVRESVGGLPPLLRLNLPRSLHMMCARALRALEGRSSHDACGTLPAAKKKHRVVEQLVSDLFFGIFKNKKR